MPMYIIMVQLLLNLLDTWKSEVVCLTFSDTAPVPKFLHLDPGLKFFLI